jgi:hypothetical protein
MAAVVERNTAGDPAIGGIMQIGDQFEIALDLPELNEPNRSSTDEIGPSCRWHEDKHVAFLKTGTPTQGRARSGTFCHVDLRRNVVEPSSNRRSKDASLSRTGRERGAAVEVAFSGAPSCDLA